MSGKGKGAQKTASKGGRSTTNKVSLTGRSNSLTSDTSSEEPGSSMTNSNKLVEIGIKSQHRPTPTQNTMKDSETENSSFDDPSSAAAVLFHIFDLPEGIMENVFTFLPVRDLPSAALVCKKWGEIIRDGNNEVWRFPCIQELSPETIHSDLLSNLPTFKAKLRAIRHAWNPRDCSRNIYVKSNGFTIHRNPVAQSTDGVRGKKGFNTGRHVWEVTWEGPLGTVAVVGIASRRADMRAQGYVGLLGQDEHSWGWNLVDNTLLHNGVSLGNFPLINNGPRYQVGEKIRVILDCENNSLAFENDLQFLGVAFDGLPIQEPLFPAVSAVYGNTEVSMVYLGHPVDD